MNQNLEKGLCIALLCGALPVAAQMQQCPANVGTIIQGNTAGRFCISNIDMNWWTGFSWCRAAGGHFATVTEACAGFAGSCANLTGVSDINKSLWLATPWKTVTAYFVNTSTGRVYEGNSAATSNGRHQKYRVLCTLP